MAESVVLDACTIITLHGCGALGVIMALKSYEFHIGPIVLKECGPGCRAALEEQINAGRLRSIPPADIPTRLFLTLLQRYRLGDGETECLAACRTLACSIATDDRAARRTATELYGPSRVTGTLGLLRAAVALGQIAPAEAVAFHKDARSMGAFLPDVTEDFFGGAK